MPVVYRVASSLGLHRVLFVFCFFNQIVKSMPNFETFKTIPSFYDKFKDILDIIQTDPQKAQKMAANNMKL